MAEEQSLSSAVCAVYSFSQEKWVPVGSGRCRVEVLKNPSSSSARIVAIDQKTREPVLNTHIAPDLRHQPCTELFHQFGDPTGVYGINFLWAPDASEFGIALHKALAAPSPVGPPPKASVSFADPVPLTPPPSFPSFVPPTLPTPPAPSTANLPPATQKDRERDHSTPDRSPANLHPSPAASKQPPSPNKVPVWPQSPGPEGSAPPISPAAPSNRGGSIDIESLKRELKEEFAAELARQLTAFKAELLAALLPHLSPDSKT